MCSTTNCENGFVSETKSHAHVQEKSTLSGGGPGSQPAKMVATSDAEKAVYKKKWKKNKGWNAVYLFSKHQRGPVLKHQQRVSKKRPCFLAVNWGTEVINLMSPSVNLIFLSVKKTGEKKDLQFWMCQCTFLLEDVYKDKSNILQKKRADISEKIPRNDINE